MRSRGPRPGWRPPLPIRHSVIRHCPTERLLEGVLLEVFPRGDAAGAAAALEDDVGEVGGHVDQVDLPRWLVAGDAVLPLLNPLHDLADLVPARLALGALR